MVCEARRVPRVRWAAPGRMSGVGHQGADGPMECGLHLINEGSQPGASRACTLTLTMTDCSEAEEEESIYSEEESGSEAADDG